MHTWACMYDDTHFTPQEEAELLPQKVGCSGASERKAVSVGASAGTARISCAVSSPSGAPSS